MSDRRVAWIRAQLDATEAAAKAAMDAAPTPWALRYDDYEDDRWLDIEAADGTAVIDTESGANGPPLEVAEYFALHDPAAVLADVEAKRAILEAYADAASKVTSMPYPDGRDIGREEALEGVIRQLAEGFRGRPGYEEAMRDGADS